MICIVTGDIVYSKRYKNPETWLAPLKNEFSRLRNTPEIPWTNEDYYYREPTKVSLKKGWNSNDVC